MNDNLIEFYKLIGQITSIVDSSTTIDSALKSCVKVLFESTVSDYVVIWYPDNDLILHPYYSLGSKDFSNILSAEKGGLVDKVFVDSKTLKQISSENSYVICPIQDETKTIGVVEFSKISSMYSEEETEIVELMTTLISMKLKNIQNISNDYFKNKKVLLSITDLHKDYQNGDTVTHVLKGIDLKIFEGEFIVFLGESGCGKSTLLNVISGLDEKTSGEIIFRDFNVTNANKNELTEYRRKNIGFVFQSYNLMMNLTVKQNIDLFSELVENPLKTEEALSLVNLSDKINSYPSQLSGGQQQRVSIARSLAKNPVLLMCDEPTAALDYETSIDVLTALENVNRHGTTICMVTHNEEITRMADRVVKLKHGKIYEVTINTNKVKATDLNW